MRYRWFLIGNTLSAISAPHVPAQQPAPVPCAQYEAAVRANPNDLAAAVSLGQCTVRDEEMIAPDGDSARLAFRTPWSPALRALRHAVEVNPSYSAAYRPLFRMLFAETRDGCSRATGFCKHVAPVLRDGDSLITIPRPVPEGPMEVSPYDGVVRETLDRQRPSLEEARALAERWATVAPNDPRPHEYRGRALLRLGDVGAAADALEHAATLGTPESRRRLFWERLEALVKSNNGAAARRLLDDAVADPGRDTSMARSYALATFNALVGRHRPPPQPPVDSARMREMRARRDSILRTRPPPPPPEPSFRDRIAVGDTAGAWRTVVKLDSMVAGTFGRGIPRLWPHHLTSAEYHLALADTAGAEERLAVIEHAFHEHPFQYRVAWAFGMLGPWVGRAWLLAGDLAAARGRRGDAAGLYRRVAGLWDGGDPEYQAVANDARVKLEALARR